MKNKEKPILFNSEMVNAILAGRKTQMRGIIKPQPSKERKFVGCSTDLGYPESTNYLWAGFELKTGGPVYFKCPYKVGMRLWVRETFTTGTHIGHVPWVRYRATDEADIPEGAKWTPSIFMPRKLSRINLEITNVQVEQIQDITENDAWAEGIDRDKANKLPYINSYGVNCAIAVFSNLWESINAKRGYGWSKNPWCFCYKFKRVK